MKMFFNISMLGLELDGAMKINDYFFINYVVLLIIGLLIKSSPRWKVFKIIISKETNKLS